MDEIKKKPEEEKSEPETPKAEEKPAETPPKSEEKPKTEEIAENADVPEPKEEEPAEPVRDEKDEEILRLKTQISAMQSGISADCLEDAVAIAESYVRNGKAADINSALSQVVKKYPNMKSDGKDEKKGGFKVGADSSAKDESKGDDRISDAFGIRRKK